MTYELNARAYVENGPAVHASAALARSSARAFAAWSKLAEDERLALIDEALAPANDVGADRLPIAL